MTTINILTPFKHCDRCRIFKLKDEQAEAVTTVGLQIFHSYSCEYAHICANAYKIATMEDLEK